MMVIWLSGYAGAGKDTMASILWKKYDLQRVAFADSLKDFVAVKYGLERSLCDTPEGKNSLDVRTGKTVRELLIADSAEAKKENINIFASYVLDKINTSKQRGFVISDWRYPHEYEYIKSNMPEAEHICIRITRPGLQSLADPSEHALDNWMFHKEIINNSLKLLEKDIVNFLATYK
jgi:hypothetical protein